MPVSPLHLSVLLACWWGGLILPAQSMPAMETSGPGPKPAWYVRADIGLSFGRAVEEAADEASSQPNLDIEPDQRNRSGYGAGVSVGYGFKPWLALGIGASYDVYDNRAEVRLLALTGHYRLLLGRGRFVPCLELAAGYGWPIAQGAGDFEEVEGGWMLDPSLGLMIGHGKCARFILGLGYRRQPFRYKRELPFSRDIENGEYHYQRLVFLLGAQF